MDNMATISEVLAKLKSEGYSIDFNLAESWLKNSKDGIKLMPSQFRVDRIFRFEEESDPVDEAIIYAISSNQHQLKGWLVNGYGVYSDKLTDKILTKLTNRANPY